MRRPILIVSVMVALALAALFLVGSRVLERDRRAMYRELAHERLHGLEGIAAGLEQDMAEIGDDLQLAATLLAGTDDPAVAERELHAIATIKREYLMMDAVGDGAARTRVIALDAPPGVGALADGALRSTLERATLAPGTVQVSGPLGGRDTPAAWYRVYAKKDERGPAVAVVVDTAVVLGRVKVVRDKASVFLAVADDGTPSRLGAGELAQVAQAHALAAAPAWALLSSEEAARLGLPPMSAVLAAASVVIDERHPVRLLLATSTIALEKQEATLVRRLALGGVLALVMLLAAASYVIFNARRAAALRERARHADRLAHLTEKAEKILDHIPSGVLALGEERTITATNRWLEDRLGGEQTGRRLEEAFGNAPRADVAAVMTLIEEARAAMAPRSLHKSRLGLLGTDALLDVHAIPLERAVADVSMLVVIEDLTPLRRAEERVLHGEKLASAGQLAAGIAHEIGTPLNIARGRAELALSRLGDHPQARSQEVIIDQIDRVIRLIHQLLDFVRPGATHTEAVDVGSAIANVVELLAARATERGVRLETAIAPALPRSRANPDQLQQVLLNLVVNALDACAEGGLVEVRASAGGGGLRIEVVDTGHGIPPELQAQVFDPFFTTKKRGQGTGLGLWMVAQVVRAHEGDIELTSVPERGTTVRIAWPVAEATS